MDFFLTSVKILFKILLVLQNQELQKFSESSGGRPTTNLTAPRVGSMASKSRFGKMLVSQEPLLKELKSVSVQISFCRSIAVNWQFPNEPVPCQAPLPVHVMCQISDSLNPKP
jgi:hypothetical protein